MASVDRFIAVPKKPRFEPGERRKALDLIGRETAQRTSKLITNRANHAATLWLVPPGTIEQVTDLPRRTAFASGWPKWPTGLISDKARGGLRKTGMPISSSIKSLYRPWDSPKKRARDVSRAQEGGWAARGTDSTRTKSTWVPVHGSRFMQKKSRDGFDIRQPQDQPAEMPCAAQRKRALGDCGSAV